MSGKDSTENLRGAVDCSVLAQICDGDSAFERRVLGNFRRAAETDAARLREAVARTDLAGVTRVSHSIKGASLTIGAGRLANVCERIEDAGRAAEWNTILANIPIFDREIDRVYAYIDSRPAPAA